MPLVAHTDVKPVNWHVTLNNIYKNHNNSSDKGAHSLMIKRQIPTKLVMKDKRVTIKQGFLLSITLPPNLHHHTRRWSEGDAFWNSDLTQRSRCLLQSYSGDIFHNKSCGTTHRSTTFRNNLNICNFATAAPCVHRVWLNYCFLVHVSTNKNILKWWAAVVVNIVNSNIPRVITFCYFPLLLFTCLCLSVYLLPAANEVWVKVMFLHLCVILFTGLGVWLPNMHHRSHDQLGLHLERGLPTGGSAYRGCLLPGPLHLEEALHPGGSASRRGVCILKSLHPQRLGRTRKVGGIHPTGMLSCISIVCLSVFLLSVCISIVHLSLCVTVIYLCLSFCLSLRLSGVRLAV